MALYENMQSETVERLQLRTPVTASLDTPLVDAIKLMREKQLGCVIAVDDANKPLHIVTRIDLLDYLTASS